jgi:hypothetical protein
MLHERRRCPRMFPTLRRDVRDPLRGDTPDARLRKAREKRATAAIAADSPGPQLPDRA